MSKSEEKTVKISGVLGRRFYGGEISQYIQEMLPCFL
jgi:hypothetical protein